MPRAALRPLGRVSLAPLLTTREVAELLGVSPDTVLRWTTRGELPGLRLPSGALRFSEEALERWLAERATGTESARNGARRAQFLPPPCPLEKKGGRLAGVFDPCTAHHGGPVELTAR